jgi:hypothetical protein
MCVYGWVVIVEPLALGYLGSICLGHMKNSENFWDLQYLGILKFKRKNLRSLSGCIESSQQNHQNSILFHETLPLTIHILFPMVVFFKE